MTHRTNEMKIKFGHMIGIFGIFGFLSFTGCSDKSSDTADAENLSCPELSLDSCAEDENCRIVGAGAMGQTADGDLCIDMNAEGEELGCIDNGPCDDAETYARAPDSETCYFFADTCIPEGWLPCAVGGVDECGQ